MTENRPASKTAMKRRKPESPCILRCLTPDPPPLLPRVLPVDDASVYMAVFRPWASDTLSPWHVPPPASGRRTLGSTSHRCCTSSWACRHRCRRLGGLMAAHRGGFNQWCVCVRERERGERACEWERCGCLRANDEAHAIIQSRRLIFTGMRAVLEPLSHRLRCVCRHSELFRGNS